MLTKLEKREYIDLGAKKVKEAKNVIFVDFTGVKTGRILSLKKELKKAGAAVQNIKKRLLKIAFKEAGIDFDPTQFPAQVAAIFVSEEEMNSAAAAVYKFSLEQVREKTAFKVLGAFDLVNKTALDVPAFLVIAKLPTREVMLGMVLGAMTAPLRAFMFILSELSKKQPAVAETALPAEASAKEGPAATA